MTWGIGVAGTVALDDVTTPSGHRENQLGGSAVYFALAAGRYAPVHLAGVVGPEGHAMLQEHLRKCPADVTIDISGLEVVDGPTYRWKAQHNISDGTTEYEEWLGPYEVWQPHVSSAMAAAPVLFLASMRPALQRLVLDQSRARMVGIDTMTGFIRNETSAVLELAAEVDVFFLNRIELACLRGEQHSTWLDDARALCGRGRPRAMVVKGGAETTAWVTKQNHVALPAYPVDRVIDPTGAGDAFAGGFLGACARAERDDEEFFTTALEEGLRCAADAISEFGVTGLLRSR